MKQPMEKSLPFALLALGLLALGALGCGALAGPEVTTYFKDAKMLREGDPVTQNGLVVGKVTAIEPLPDGRIEVRMRLDKKTLGRTRTRSLAFIASDAGGRQRVELHPQDLASAPLAAGDRLEGIETQLELQLRRAAAAIKPTLDAVERQVGQTVRDLDAYLDSAEGKKLATDTREFLGRARDRIDTQIKNFRASHPDWEVKLKQQLEEARRQGNKALLKVLQELEQTLQEADRATRASQESSPDRP